MHAKGKVINDPIYGMLEIPYGILFDLLEHRYYQRLRRITQLGFTHYVYPGALHNRFNHTIGALHLMQRAIQVLRSKDISISNKEAEAVSIAILLHDIGHGPFSHCLEYSIIQTPHEVLSIAFMEQLNEEFEGKLTTAIAIFKNQYPKKFLYQLVSGQLDMDRLDYLSRDSFFTGVSEGVIGYNRIIEMLNVHNDQLVIEHKGLYSIEKFLIARRLMYWQVYLHKVVICAGEMTIRVVQRARVLLQQGQTLAISPQLHYFLSQQLNASDLKENRVEILEHFSKLDDIDILYALKSFCKADDFILSYLSKSLEGQEANKAYDVHKQEIMIHLANGHIRPISEWREHNIPPQSVIKYYVCHPKKLFS